MSRPTTESELKLKLGSEKFTSLDASSWLLGKFPMVRRHGGADGGELILDRREDPIFVRDPEPEREEDLAFRIQATRSARFDSIDRECRQPRLPRELCLAHHERFTVSLDVVVRHSLPLQRAPGPNLGAARSTVLSIGEWLRGLEASWVRPVVSRITLFGVKRHFSNRRPRRANRWMGGRPNPLTPDFHSSDEFFTP